MTTLTAKDPKILLAQHLETLRRYADRVLARNIPLDPLEKADTNARLRELFAIGDAFRLTERDIVMLLYGVIFRRKARCGCHHCRSRPAL